MRNLVVTFDTNVWPKSKRKGFFFPQALAVAFGKIGKQRHARLSLDLKVAKTSEPSKPIFDEHVLLVSETEVTTPRLFRNLKCGDEIRVTACNPRFRNQDSK